MTATNQYLIEVKCNYCDTRQIVMTNEILDSSRFLPLDALRQLKDWEEELVEAVGKTLDGKHDYDIRHICPECSKK